MSSAEYSFTEISSTTPVTRVYSFKEGTELSSTGNFVGGVSSSTLGSSSISYSTGGVLTSGSSAANVVSSIANDLLNSKLNVSSSQLSRGGSATLIQTGLGSSGIIHSTHSNSNLIYQSAYESAILQASNPIDLEEGEELTIGAHTGRLINKQEILKWNGVVPISQYEINIDVAPEVIRKKTQQQLLYEQEVAIRYLRPPTPPPPGEILIKQEANIPTPPAPPLVIRQVPPRPDTPQPLIVREAPPKAPVSIGQKIITISGKRLPPPPRKVVIERLAPLPSKPQAIMIERWLPYAERKRRIIFQKNQVPDPIIPRPKNVIVQWEVPEVQIKTIYKDLGVVRANPNEYVEKFGVSLLSHSQFPEAVKSFNIRPPTGYAFASEFVQSSLVDLEGDISALNMINLDEHGLGEYRSWLNQHLNKSSSHTTVISGNASDMINGNIAEIFKSVDVNNSSRISLAEAQELLVNLNIQLGRSYTSQDALTFLRTLDTNKDGFIDFEEFRTGLLALYSQ